MRPPFLFPVESPGQVILPQFGHRDTAVFPLPADNYVEDRLGLNELLVQRQEATDFQRVKGDTMVGAGKRAFNFAVSSWSLLSLHPPAPIDRTLVMGTEVMVHLTNRS
jgi:DNA polymerase V